MNMKRGTLAVLLIIIISLILLVSACSNSAPVINRISPENTCVNISGTVAISCNASDADGDELVYAWSATGGEIASMSPEVTWTAPDKPGIYTIMLSVTDTEGNEAVEQISIGVVASQPPVIDSLLIEPSAVGVGQQATITCQAHDPEGEELYYQWEVDDGDLSVTGPVVNWTPPYDKKASVIRVKVADQQGESATMAINVNILPNHNPEIESLTSQPRSLTPGAESAIRCVARDADGDELEYQWKVSSGVIAGSGAEVVWTAPEDCAKYNISVTVRDGRGGEATKELKITVAKSGG